MAQKKNKQDYDINLVGNKPIKGDLIKIANEENYPADLAEYFDNLSKKEKLKFLSKADNGGLSSIFEHFASDSKKFIIANLAKEKKINLLEELKDDVLTDFLQTYEDESKVKDILKLLGQKDRKVAQELLKYSEESAGGRMTTYIAKLDENMTIGDAISYLDKEKESSELLARIYVVDNKNRILGKVRLRDLTFNKKSIPISAVMAPQPVAILADEDQEEAANLILKYDLISLPVIDKNNCLLGIITYDDAMEILQEETTEDIEKISGIGGKREDVDYLATSVFNHIRRRIFWILSLGFAALLSGIIIYNYENVLGACFILAIYMPMIVAAGGNTGGQSAIMVIRAMSLGEFSQKKFFLVIWKELRIGLLIGLILGIAIGLQIYLFPLSKPTISAEKFALTVFLGLIFQVTTSTVIGATLPIMAKYLKVDPAAVASPVINTLVDISGLVIYFSLAKIILGLG